MSYCTPRAVLLFHGVAWTDVGTMLRPARAGGRYNFVGTAATLFRAYQYRRRCVGRVGIRNSPIIGWIRRSSVFLQY